MWSPPWRSLWLSRRLLTLQSLLQSLRQSLLQSSLLRNLCRSHRSPRSPRPQSGEAARPEAKTSRSHPRRCPPKRPSQHRLPSPRSLQRLRVRLPSLPAPSGPSVTCRGRTGTWSCSPETHTNYKGTMMPFERRNEPLMLRQFSRMYPSYNLSPLFRTRHQQLVEAQAFFAFAHAPLRVGRLALRVSRGDPGHSYDGNVLLDIRLSG